MYLTYYWFEDDGEGGISFESKDYEEIRNLSFSPEIDLYGLSLPVNEFTADIVTEDEFLYNNVIDLSDDMDGLWARFYVKNAVKVQPGMVRLTARSWIGDLEYAQMDAVMYQSEPAADVIEDCIEAGLPNSSGLYTIDSSFSGATVTGYCPEQSARERLTWVLFAIGACVRQSFGDAVQILPIDNSASLIPWNRTFMRPEISEGEWVTAVKVTAFTFTEAQSQEDWEADDSSYRFPLPWVATEQSFTLSNNSAPAGVPENVKEIDELYIINSGNVNAVLNRLAAYYFNRTEVSLDCVNNRQYLPGDKVTGYLSEEELVSGFITQAAFSFGLQARSRLKLSGVEKVTGAKLILNYVYSGTKIGQAKYYLPVGTSYSIENPYIDRTKKKRRRVYRPQSESATGTVSSGTNTVTVQYDIALECYQGNLTVYYADTVETSDDVGVIS